LEWDGFAVLMNRGTRIVQADSGSDSDSESRRQSAQRMAFVLTVQVRIVVAGSCGSVQTVGVRRFTGIISSFLFRLSESESEPQSACTIRVPYLGRVVRRKVSHKTGRPFGRPRRRGGGDMRVELQQDKHRTYNVT